jgi:hypothetical protein
VLRDYSQLSRRQLRTVFLACCVAGAAACASARGVPSVEGPTIPTFTVGSVTRDSAGASLSALVGTVEDSVSGWPLGGAIVSLTARLGSQHYYSYTDQFGGFIVQRVPPGSYDLLIRKVAYRPYAAPHSMRAGVVDTLRSRIRAFHINPRTAQGLHTPLSVFIAGSGMKCQIGGDKQEGLHLSLDWREAQPSVRFRMQADRQPALAYFLGHTA